MKNNNISMVNGKQESYYCICSRISSLDNLLLISFPRDFFDTTFPVRSKLVACHQTCSGITLIISIERNLE